MVNQKQAIQAIRKAKNVFVVTRLAEHDMAYVQGVKKDLVREINSFAKKYSTAEFNISIHSNGDVVIG